MSVYTQNILEHYKRPQNKTKMKDADLVLENINRSCGDEVVVYLKKNSGSKSEASGGEDVIERITFEGNGCAISMATCSILSEELVGMNRGEVLDLKLEDVEDMLGVKIGANRVKCALLGLETIQKLLLS